MIITRTPVRISLGGGGTDIVSYSSTYGGLVLSATIDKYVFINVNPRPLDSHIRVSYSETETVRSSCEIKHPLIREALRLTKIKGGLEITSIADVPANSGLGTSGSFTTGLLLALHTLKRESISTHDLAEEACSIEIDTLKEPIGKHDQFMAAYGGITCLMIEPDGSVTATPANISRNVVQNLEHNLLLFFTGVTRNSSDVLKIQDRSSKDGDNQVIERLHEIKEIGIQILRSLEQNDLSRFGELLDSHWQSKTRLSKGVSTGDIDKWYQLGKDNGALGGKIIGAGGGGFLMFYCETDREKLREAMAAQGLVEMPFHFDFEGSKVLVNF